jgi:hypothetical protein
MDNDRFEKLVDFNKYCPLCKYRDYAEVQDPCNDCLNEPARSDGSRKPVNFKEKK